MEIGSATVVLGFVLMYIIYWWTKKNTNYWKEKGVPHAKALPIIGSVKDVVMAKKTMVQYVKSLYNEFQGEKYCGYNLFTTPVLLIRDIDLINQILIKDFSHFHERNFPGDEHLELFNSSLANISGDKWKVLRHKMTPIFTSGKMKVMFDKIKNCSEDSVIYLKDKKNEDIDVRDFMFRFVINVIADTSIGIKANAFSNDKEKTNLFVGMSSKFLGPSRRKGLAQLLAISAPRIKDFFKINLGEKEIDDFFQNLSEDLKEHRKESSEKRDDLLQLMLEERRKELNILTAADESIIDEQTKMCKDEEPEDLELLEHLKNIKYDKNSKVFSDKIIAAQILTFVAAGTDTVASVLSFALYELAANKHVQIRAQREIASILDNQELNYQSVKKMTYLDQILNEVLRLRPPAGNLPRICTKDYKLPMSNLTLKKGSVITIPVAAIHLDPEYYPNPETFNPDRFENMETIPKGPYYPFGGGPRICIAMRLALLQMKVLLAEVLSHYNVILSEKTKLPLKMDTKSFLQHVEGGLYLRFEPRRQ